MKKQIISTLIIFLCIFSFGSNEAKTELNLNAKNAILFDRTSKRVLYEKEAYTKVPNASTTKILTAIVVIENCNISEKAEISQKAASVIGSKVKFRKGDKITVNDLLHGLLLCSGNDAAIALAEHVSGSIEVFCEKMNKKAKEIGAINTHFVTPHGLNQEGHFSTAYDLALLADYALNNPYLANIFSKKTETIYINDVPRKINTTNEMLHVYEGADGVKTGFTNQAGRCLVTSATNEKGWQLIAIVLGCDTKNFRTQDSKKLLDYGFNNYEFVNIGEILPKVLFFEVEKSKERYYKLEINYNYLYPLTEDEKKELRYEQTEISNLEAPVMQDTELVKYKICIRKRKNCRNHFKIRSKNR